MVKRILLSFVVFGGLVPAMASAQVASVGDTQLVSYSDLIQRMDSMETELASYRAQSLNYASTPSCGGDGCGSDCCSTPCCGVCCIRSGWYAGFDVVYAKPYFEDGVEQGDPNYDFEFSPRVILGFKNECGRGIRARGWWFDADSNPSDGTASTVTGTTSQLGMNVFDIELTQDVCWGPVQATLFGGVRYADIDHTMIVGGDDFNSATGWGPTLGIDTLTPVTCRTSVVGNFRYSALFGTVDSEEFGPGDDNAFSSIDTQLGLQWERELGCGVLRLNGIVESQLWMSTVDDPANLDSGPDEDLLMLGFVFGVEYQR